MSDAASRSDAAGAGVAAVVLAAGSSERMGRNKLLIELDGEAMVRRCVRRACEAGFDPVLVVLGHEAERVEAQLAGLRYVRVWNPEHAAGMRTSLQAGIRSAAAAEAAVVVLADMPLVTTGMMAALRARYAESGAPLVVSRYGEVDAPPTLYHRSLFPELRALEGRHTGKYVARRHADAAAVVSWPAAALRDVDRPSDLANLRLT